jgi:hypothetical protein
MPPSLRLEEFSDRELLYALEEHADDDGTVSSRELAEGLGLTGMKNPHQNIAIRLSWLKRYGVVYRDQETGRWGLTPVGETLMHSNLRAAERRLLEGLDPDKLLVVMQQLGGAMINANSEAATMAAREWRYSMAARKRRAG